MSELCSQRRREFWASLTLEQKKSVLSSNIHSQRSYENMAKSKVGFYGRMPIEARTSRDKAISEGNKKRWESYTPEERKARLNKGVLNKLTFEKGRIAFRKFIASLTPEQKREWVLRSIQSDKVLKNKGASLKKIWDSYTDEERAERIRNIAKSNAMRPSEPELILQKYLDTHFPNEWVYNGDCSKGIVFGTKVPDLFNVNSKKIILEVFGMYWHKPEEVEPLKAHYAKYGFECIIIWEDECNDEDLDRILSEV